VINQKLIDGWQLYEITPASQKSSSPIYFLHATGFSVQCYFDFLQEWADSSGRPIYSFDSRGFGQTTLGIPASWYQDKGSVWQSLSTDFINVLDLLKKNFSINENETPLLCGHSLGAVVALSSAEKLNFKQVLVLDPVALPFVQCVLWGFATLVGLRHLHPLGRSVASRRVVFDSKQAAHDYYRRKYIFKLFSKEALNNYIESCFKKSDDNVSISLRFTPETEALMFQAQPTWMPRELRRLSKSFRNDLELTAIRASHGEMLKGFAEKVYRRTFRNLKLIELENSTHMYPIEKSKELLKLI
jgi:pimeloyl-ACP methyl ester carboxylesterase